MKKTYIIFGIFFAVVIALGIAELVIVANADIPDWMKMLFILK